MATHLDWHPVLEAFGHNKSANSSYTPDPWFYPTELHDNQKEAYKLLPVEIENYHDYVIVYPLYRLIVFHHTAKPRNKMINLLTSKLALPGDSVYFHSLKTRRPGAPLPTIPDWVKRCLRSKAPGCPPRSSQATFTKRQKSSWKTYVQANNIMVPDRPVTLEEFNQISTPPTAGDFPTPSETVGPKPSAKAPVAAKKGSLTAQSTKALRPLCPTASSTDDDFCLLVHVTTFACPSSYCASRSSLPSHYNARRLPTPHCPTYLLFASTTSPSSRG